MTILREVSEAFKFKYVPQILISKAVASPVTIGISRVSVFIPESLYVNMTENEFRSILFHEFAHIHHKDHLFSILDKLIIGMNWWNPLVYHISTEQNMAREDICDNYAIKGIKSAEVYSNCLVNLAEKICLISNLPATAGMAGKKSGLEQRIKSILSKERKMFSTTKKAVKLATIVLCTLAICFIGGISVSCAEIKGKKQPQVNTKSKDNKNAELKADKITLTGNKQLVLTGNASLKKDKNILKGDKIRIHMDKKSLKTVEVSNGKITRSKTVSEKEIPTQILIQVLIIEKPQMNSPASECKIISSPQILGISETKSRISIGNTSTGIDKEVYDGFILEMTPAVNGDHVNLKGKVSIGNKQEIFYDIGAKAKNQANKIVFGNAGKFFEIRIWQTVIDKDTNLKALLKEFKAGVKKRGLNYKKRSN